MYSVSKKYRLNSAQPYFSLKVKQKKNAQRSVLLRSVIYEKNMKSKIWHHKRGQGYTICWRHQQPVSAYLLDDNIQNVCCTYRFMHTHAVE